MVAMDSYFDCQTSKSGSESFVLIIEFCLFKVQTPDFRLQIRLRQRVITHQTEFFRRAAGIFGGWTPWTPWSTREEPIPETTQRQ